MEVGGFSFGRLFGSRYLRESVFFVGLQQMFQVAIGLFQMWVLTATLSRVEYGIWGYVAALVAMATIFTLPGVNQAITYGAIYGQHGVLLAGMRWRLRYGLISTLVLLILAGTHLYTNQSQAAALLLIAALFMPIFQSLESVDAFLTGLGNFRALFWRKVVLHGGLALLLWGGAVTFGSLWVCGLIVYGGGAVMSGLLFVSLLKYRRNDLLPDGFRGLAGKLSLQSVGSTISHSMERPLLSQFVGFGEMAAYNVALTAQIPVSYGRLIERILISRLGKGEGGINRSWVWYGTWLLFGLGWPAWLVMVVGVRWLMPILFPGYVDAIPLMEILLLQTPFAWGAKPGLSWFLARPQTHVWYHRFAWGIIMARIFFITLGVWFGGMWGVVWAWVGVEGLTFLAVVIVLFSVGRERSLT